MRDDEIGTHVKTDELILQFGERLFEKLGHHVHNYQYIAQRMRELARRIIAMKTVKPNCKQNSPVSSTRELGLAPKSCQKSCRF